MHQMVDFQNLIMNIVRACSCIMRFIKVFFFISDNLKGRLYFCCFVTESSDFLFLFQLLYPEIIDCNGNWKNFFESFHLMHRKSP